ncbi:hypothetical protein [Thauera humireducens]
MFFSKGWLSKQQSSNVHANNESHWCYGILLESALATVKKTDIFLTAA